VNMKKKPAGIARPSSTISASAAPFTLGATRVAAHSNRPPMPVMMPVMKMRIVYQVGSISLLAPRRLRSVR